MVPGPTAARTGVCLIHYATDHVQVFGFGRKTDRRVEGGGSEQKFEISPDGVDSERVFAKVWEHSWIEQLFKPFVVTPRQENAGMVASTRPKTNHLASPVGRPRPADRSRRLHLVVDNTRSGESLTSAGVIGWDRAPVTAPQPEHGPPGPAMLGQGWSLVGERVRLGRQLLLNRFGPMGLAGRLAGYGPMVALAAAIIFGGLLAMRLAQEAGPSSLAGLTSSTMVDSAPSTSPLSSGSGAAFSLDGPKIIVVHPGDSLWSIANDRFPGDDPRTVVDALIEANEGSVVQVGQPLIVPDSLADH